MTRTLSVIVDDEAKTIGIDGWYEFSIIELFGIAEHINLKARLADIRIMSEAQMQEEEAAEQPEVAQEEVEG